MNLLFLLIACTDAPAPPEGSASEERLPYGWVLGSSSTASPEVPRHAPPIHLMDEDDAGDLAFELPTLPGLRSSADARLGINPRMRGPNVELYLLSPETLQQPLGAADPGVHGWIERTLLAPDDFYVPTGGDDEPLHYTLCDASPDMPGPDDTTNPHPCPEDTTRDCYDLTVVHSLGIDHKETQLWGTPLHVEVSDPKTLDAAIAHVELGEPVGGTVFSTLVFKEMNASGDGRLLVMRDDWSRNPFPDPDDPTQTHDVSINVVYAYSVDPDAYAPCDVRQWTDIQPITHFPHDPAVAHYPLAHFPFLDSEFAPIADFAAMGVSYPWVDRDVTNLMFMSSRATLFYDEDTSDESDDTIGSRYPERCLPGETCGQPIHDIPDSEDGISGHDDKSLTRGVGVVGLWTRGKMVVLDGLINNTDYGLPRRRERQRELQLYEPGTGPDPASATGWLRVGTGFDNGLLGTFPPLGTSHNAAVIESTTHLYFQHDAHRSRTWRDVVWMTSVAKAAQEVAFDDYLDRNALIVTEMTASVRSTGDFGRPSLEMMDGFHLEPPSGFPGFGRPVHFQNAASPELHLWSPPRFGLGYGGVRAEPVALGGIWGRGLWLEGLRDGIVYRFADEPVVGGTAEDSAALAAYTGLFYEPRLDDDGIQRDLLTYPDDSAVVLEGVRRLLFVDGSGAVQGQLDLPWAWEGWHHLGLQRTSDGLGVTVLLDGLPYAELSFDEPLLTLGKGRVHLGDAPANPRDGARGWFDELKLWATAPSPELACNHARGTLVLLDSDSLRIADADLWPAATHAALDDLLGTTGGRYLCHHDYDSPSTQVGNPLDLPDDATPVREPLLFPEGPVHWSEPRPDSVGNPFCLTCHSPDHAPGLSLAALAFDPRVPAVSDPRRQPSQPPPRVFGVVPADYVGPGMPLVETVAPPEGLLVDPWLLPD